jgi:hypothetical protein
MWPRFPSVRWRFGPPSEVPLAEPETGRFTTGQSAGEDSKGIAANRGGFVAPAAARLRVSGPVAWLVFGLGVLAAILLVVAEFSNLRHTSVVTATCQDLAGSARRKCSSTAGEHHGYALIPIAALVLVMAWGAAVGRARAAALALLALGAVVVVIALAVDLPDTRKAGVLAEDFSGAKEHAGPAIVLELGGAAAAIGAGLVGLRRRRVADDEDAELDARDE